MSQPEPMEPQRILDLLSRQGGLKAKDIASGLGADRADVNATLYGSLKGRVRQDSAYRWWPQTAAAPPRASTGARGADTPLARLARYYLDVLSYEGDADISVFAASRSDPDYAALSELPLGPSSDLFQTEAARALLDRVEQDRKGSVLYLGYPVRLRKGKGRNGWSGFFAEPVFVIPFDLDNVDPSGRPVLDLDGIALNPQVVRTFSEGGERNVLDEAVHLAEELGLHGEEPPELDEVFLRLRDLRPDWDWAEPTDPHALSEGRPLGALSAEGIYNRAALIKGKRSPYTVGLEKELAELARLKESDYADTALGRWIAGNRGPEGAHADPLLLEPLPLNGEQRQAVGQALDRPLTVVTGPPGTGKSQVVASMLINAAWQGKRVLFASKNHKAVDVVEDRVNGLGPRPVLLRLGSSFDQLRRLADHLSQILAATAGPADRAEYADALGRHERLRSRAGGLDDALSHTVALRNELDGLEQEAEGARSVLGAATFARMARFDPEPGRGTLDALNRALERAGRSRQGWLLSAFWPIARGRRHRELAEAGQNAHALVEALGGVLPASAPSDVSLDDWEGSVQEAGRRFEAALQATSYFAKLEALGQSRPLEAVATERVGLQADMAENSDRLWDRWLRLQPDRLTPAERDRLGAFAALLRIMADGLENGGYLGREVWREYYRSLPSLLGTLPCWAVTSLSAGRLPLKPGYFDLVVIDEASQCDIASALPLLYRAKQAVVIGDPMQLTHITGVSKRQDSQLLGKHDLVQGFAAWSYSASSLFDLASTKASSADVVGLRDHHRSHADVIGFSNEHFYEGRLRVATDYDRLRRPDAGKAVRWTDVPGRAERPEGGSVVNENEARAVAAELRRLVVEGGFRGTVGVVTPFRAHARRIREIVDADAVLVRQLAGADFVADTAHKFQGDERDVIVFSPVVAEGMAPGTRSWLNKERNVFNVAVTRARAALYVVGDKAAALSSDIDYLSRFASYVDAVERGAGPAEARDGGGAGRPGSDRGRDPWAEALRIELERAGVYGVLDHPVEQYRVALAVMDGERPLAIDVDTELYHRPWNEEHVRRDQIRTQRLIELGWDPVRVWVYQVRDDLPGTVARIVSETTFTPSRP